MSKARYIYIDDFDDQSVQAIKDGLSDTGIIDVKFLQAREFTSQITSFENDLGQFDGIILDLRLDGNASLNIKYTANSLAQELRSRSAANEGIKDTPLILCSTDKKIQDFYDKDQTSHDLFDYSFLKEAAPDWDVIATKLQAISDGYKKIEETRKDLSLIFEREVGELEDDRILGKFVDKESNFPIHEYALYIINELLNKPGPLINSQLLAARLGIDIEKSNDWDALLKQVFSKQKYTGVFSSAWERWWSDLVIKRFRGLTGKRLASLNAEERVELLKKESALSNLVAAKPIDKSVSSNFWTICEYFKKPLDPLEGFKMLYKEEPKPWQDYRYLSFEAAAERRGRIHPTENEKLEMLKKSQKNK